MHASKNAANVAVYVPNARITSKWRWFWRALIARIRHEAMKASMNSPKQNNVNIMFKRAQDS
jgi:hypothetical protein